MLPLAYTANKIAIRQTWDKPIIAHFSTELARPLNYLGLPGPTIQDFIDWREYLGWKTGIEFFEKKTKDNRECLRRINELQKNVMLQRLNDQWELRKGSLEDIVIDGVDIDGQRPHLLVLEKNQPPRMKYDLHNWDFQNGLAYANQNNSSKKLRAINRCFELQRGHPFLFLLTLNTRHALGEEPTLYLNGLANEIHSAKHKDIINWYANQNARKSSDHCRTMAIIPHIVRQAAHLNASDCFCYPPLYYEGDKANMLHFVFAIRPKGTILPVFSGQSNLDVIELPLMQVKDGKAKIYSKQHPAFEQTKAIDLLTKLGFKEIIAE